ncbi:DNA type IV secretion system protein ComB10 [Helicobacter typhlonius]|uniref:TrbI/VirB10 family protein n=8 Tax=Helicobacter typhlonius TaxID=76936 RepID=A0A0S4PTZ3_9HELI|nr:DNA type IV secretion system protein ComB10 [Helicobacter typhlonius]TLD79418.1 TrbI/VirB10 family protein [Helicobacter typhlonius]CUU39489.1 Type IV secretion/competence protein (VirB10) [Helicobacter typhlonius]
MVYKGIGIFALLGMGITYASVKENLDYLFESKFPISDYVWQQKGTHQGDLSKSNIFNQSHIQPNLTMLTDELGNPILDENGDPIYIDKEGNMYSGEGKKILDKKILLDKTGKPILDKNGNHIFIDKNGNLKDKNDNPILDSNGNPININNKEALNEFLNKNTQNSPEEQLRRQQELLAEAQRQAELQEQMRKKLEEEARKKAEEEMKKLADPTYQALLAKQEEERARRIALAKERELYKSALLGERAGGDSQIFAQQSSRYGDDGFSNQKSIDIATNEHRLYRMIRAGRLIPAVLMTPIVSNIEGIITAQVEQDVYAAQGRVVLIPRGTKVMGFYKNDNKIGQSRLSIVWREMITPQGVNILLTNAVSADSRGINGIEGYLDNKFEQRYGLGLFLNTLSNGLMITISNATQKSGTGANPYTTQLFSNAQGDLNNIFKQLISEQAKIKPTIEIRAGSRIYITPTTHMWFPIPKNGEVMAKYFNDEYN